MNFTKHKLPTLKHKRLFIKQNNDNNIEDFKLTIYNTQKINLSKTPLKLKNIRAFNKLDKNTNTSNINDIENKNNENNLINELLYQKIKINKYLKPIKILPKSKSSVNINNNYSFFFNDNIENEKTNYKNNKIFLLFQKFNKNFNGNSNIKKITNINRYLIKKNENDTNGNFIFNDYNEEQKESITFIMNNNNEKEIYKKKLTKDIPDTKLNNKLNENFKFYGKRFDSPTLKNIRRIKYMQAITQQKNKDINDINVKNDNKNINNNNDKYNFILREKIRNMENQIDITGKNLLKMDNLIKSCLTGSRIQFEKDSKNIFGNIIE